MEYYGIDVSSYNGGLDWSKASGISFIIQRITQLYGVDSSFERNYKGAKEAGLKIGGYRFSYATNASESRTEALGVLDVLQGRPLDFPIFLDLEWAKQEGYSKSQFEAIIEAFRTPIVEAGYKFGIYTTKYWYENLLPDSVKKYDFWIANYPYAKDDDGSVQERLRPTGIPTIVGWQYSGMGYGKVFGGKASELDLDLFYTDYKEETMAKTVAASDVLTQARKWLGKKESDGSHKVIIDTYNSYKPLARGYKVQYTDQWCDTFVSAVFIALNAVGLLGGTECGVEEHTKLFKAAGIWIEDGTITPKPGDIIVFNWDKSTQPNDGYSDHIGIVESVSGSTITTIEGNYKDIVARRTLKVGNGNIRGYARPKYGETAEAEPVKTETPTTTVPATPVTTKKTRLMLQRGNSGDEVKFLQQCLIEIGHGIKADGSFGFNTYLAVTAFQSNHGLTVDGVVGEKTWERIKKALNDKISVINGLLSKF